MRNTSLLQHFFKDIGQKRAMHAIDVLRSFSVGRIREILLASRPVESDPENFIIFIQSHIDSLDLVSDKIYWACAQMSDDNLLYVESIFQKKKQDITGTEKPDIYDGILQLIHKELSFRIAKKVTTKALPRTNSANQGKEVITEISSKETQKQAPKEQVVSTPKLQSKTIPKASREAMTSWYLHGPDFLTGDAVSGKSIVQQLIINGNFRLGWTQYVKSISPKIWKKLGCKFPLTIPGIPDETGKISYKNQSVLEFFNDADGFQISQLMQAQRKTSLREDQSFDGVYLENMKRWYHQGYIDPYTNIPTNGKTIIQQCILSKQYTKAFASYAQGLDASTTTSIGFAIRTSLSTNFALLGIPKGDMKIESLLKALGEEDIESMLNSISKQHRKINVSPTEYLEKIQHWYHVGYLTDAGKNVTGKEVLIDCVQKNGGYLENYRNYVNTITPTEEKRIGVRFHTSFHGIFRFLGKDPKGTLLDILITVGEADTVPIIQLLKRPLRATKTKLDSDIPTSDKVRETKSTTGVSRKAKSIRKKSSKKLVLVPEKTEEKKELTGRVFGDDIPENFHYGLRQCYLKIRKCMLTIVDIQESDIGIMREDNKIVIIFRTPEVVEKIRQNIYLVEQAIEEANENVFRVVANMTPAAAKGISCIAFTVSTKE